MADPITLQSLSDLITITQAELDDLKPIVITQGTRLTTAESNIATLQSPATGVPPELLQWFVDGHTITEVDTTLSNDIADLNASIATHTGNITTLQTGLANEITDRTTGDSNLQTQIDTINATINTVNNTLTQEIADRAALAADVASMNANTNTRIDNIASDLSSAEASSSNSIAALNSQVASLSSAFQLAQTQILLLQNIGVDPLAAQASQITALTVIANDASTATAAETTARVSADNSLQAAINSAGASLSGIQSSLTTETNARIAADSAINASLGTLNTTVSGHTAAIAAETAARISADSTINTTLTTHTTDIATNASDIATETTNRGSADTALQTQITTNSGNITTNTANISTLQNQVSLVNTEFGVVKDGSGYLTGWQILDQSASASSALNLRNLNNDVRMQNPGYAGKYFPPVAVASFAPATSYDTQYGTGPSTNFRGTDTNDYTRSVNVYATASVGINGSVFMGVDYSTGGNLNRLGQVLTTFVVDFSGYVNGQLSLWYRIKATPGDTTQRWFPVAMGQISKPSPGTYEMASHRAVVQISVTANQVIEFGLTNLSTLDASRAATNTFIYNGAVSVTALNMVTIS